MFSNFDDVVANGQFVENAPDIGGLYQRPDIPPVQPTAPVTDQKQPPQDGWGWKQQREWNVKMAQKVDGLAQNMAAKAEMQQGFAEINAKLADVVTKLNNLTQR